MICHFSLVLLCLSGAYCIPSVIDYLDLNGFKQVFNNKTNIPEWKVAMAQQIVAKDVNGTKTTVDVKAAVDYFKQIADNSTARDLEWIRSVIKTAYECTFTRYATITAYLIFQDLWEQKTNISWSINNTKLYCSKFDIRSIFKNKTYQEWYRSMQWKKRILDYDIKLENKGNEKIYAYHRTFSTPRTELHNFWAGFIEKKLGFKIKYKIYTEVIKTRFTNEYNLPLIDTLNELACVINEAIQLFDRFFVDKCVPHDSSFVKNFESLKTGILGDFTGLLAHFDENKAREATYDGQLLKYNPKGAVPVSYLVDRDANSELYQDFSKPIPGKFPAFSEITASGCFVEYVEFEISGLKTDFENTTDPRNIYGQTSLVRTSEMEMKLIENPHYKEKSDVKIGMIMFRDGDKSFKKYPESSRHIT